MVEYIDVDMKVIETFHDDSIWQAKVKGSIDTLKEAGYRVSLRSKRKDVDDDWQEV